MLKDMQWESCPNPEHKRKRGGSCPYYWYAPMMRIPMEGPTNIVRCWRCGHEEPRFKEVKEPEKKKVRKTTNGPWKKIRCTCGHSFNAQCPLHG